MREIGRRLALVSLAVLASAFPYGAAMADLGVITAQSLRSERESGAPVIVIDVGPRETFDRAHIPGAIHVPTARMNRLVLRPDAKIVVYDSAFGIRRSRESAASLLAKGFQGVSVLDGGLAAWRSAGLPIVGPDNLERNLHLFAVTARQLVNAVNDGEEFVLVDLRNPAAFVAGKYAGAINVAPEDVKNVSGHWGKNKWVIFYDDGKNSAQAIVRKLVSQGFRQVGYVQGGYSALVVAGS